MKFYGITMEGKFINQSVGNSIVTTFNSATDTGRLVYNNEDGMLWWGDGFSTPGRWRTVGASTGDASEVEDFYSDLLRTSMFKRCTWDEFSQTFSVDDMIDKGNSTAALATQYNSDGRYYTMSVNQYLQTNSLFDTLEAGVPSISYVMPSILWTDNVADGTENFVPTIYLSTKTNPSFPADFTVVGNNEVHRFTNSDLGELTMRVVATGPGKLHAIGVLYSKDPSVTCTRYMFSNEIITIGALDSKTQVPTPYVVGGVLVFLNGVLLADGLDYDATDGEFIDFSGTTPLQENDVVQVVSVLA